MISSKLSFNDCESALITFGFLNADPLAIHRHAKARTLSNGFWPTLSHSLHAGVETHTFWTVYVMIAK